MIEIILKNAQKLVLFKYQSPWQANAHGLKKMAVNFGSFDFTRQFYIPLPQKKALKSNCRQCLGFFSPKVKKAIFQFIKDKIFYPAAARADHIFLALSERTQPCHLF